MTLQQQIKGLLVHCGRWISSKELLIYLTFVVLASSLWYGHAMTSVRNAQVKVKINYSGIPENITFSTPLPETITIEIRDAGRRLVAYSGDDMQATLDISPMIHGKQGEIRITEDVLRRNISGLLQGTSKLQQINPEQIHASYYTQQERTVPIQIQGTITPAQEYLFTEEPTTLAKTIRIYGSRDAIKAVDTIYTEEVTLTELRDTTYTLLHLTAPEGIRLSSDTVSLRTIAERFTEKIFVVSVATLNVPEDKLLRTFPHEVTVTTRVSLAHFAQVEAQHVYAYCLYPRSNQNEVSVHVSYKNPYIYGVRVSPPALEFIIENNDNEE